MRGPVTSVTGNREGKARARSGPVAAAGLSLRKERGAGGEKRKPGHARKQVEATLAGRIPSEVDFPFLFLFLIFQSRFSNKF
jgi:hypothetical protein